eukprot:gene7952-12419_t
MIGCTDPNTIHFTHNAQEINCIMLGKSSSGKTTILYKLFMNEVINFPPTQGFHKENLQHRNYQFSIFDLGGEDINEWKQYSIGKDVLIFFVDFSNQNRLIESSNLLHKIMNQSETKDTLLMVFANKFDLIENKNSITVEDIEKKLNLKEIKQKFKVFKTRVDMKESYLEGFDWILETVNSNHQKDKEK